jgi:hypothetical protein
MYIHSASAFIGEANAEVNTLKEEIRLHTRETFRRGNRFILLSLLGAFRCVHRHTLEPNTAVYLTTEHGSLGDTVTVLDEIYAARSLPKPYGFINTMSNTAAFYLAQNLGIRGRNITVSSQCVSFERGLELARVDLAGGAEKNALIGGVDEASFPDSVGGDRNHRLWRRVDGSGWFYVKSEREGACGAFRENRSFRDGHSFRRWIERQERPAADVVSFGAMVGEEEAAEWRETLRPLTEFDYLHDHGYSGSATACGISLFFNQFQGRTLLHVNRDPRGHYTVLEVERY